mgnify:CR=1 FL=1
MISSNRVVVTKWSYDVRLYLHPQALSWVQAKIDSQAGDESTQAAITKLQNEIESSAVKLKRRDEKIQVNYRRPYWFYVKILVAIMVVTCGW